MFRFMSPSKSASIFSSVGDPVDVVARHLGPAPFFAAWKDAAA